MKGTEPADGAPEGGFQFGQASNLHATQKLEREMELLPVGPAHDTPREGITQIGLSFFNVIPDFFRHPQSYEYPPLIRNRVAGHLSKGGPACRHGNGSPLAARSSRYHSSRVNSSSGAFAACRILSGWVEPMI